MYLFLCVLWEHASSSSSIYLHWATSCGDRLGITGCCTLGGGTTLGGDTTLGGGTIGKITGVASESGLGYWKSSRGLDNFCGNPNSFFLVVQPALCGSVFVVELVGSRVMPYLV